MIRRNGRKKKCYEFQIVFPFMIVHYVMSNVASSLGKTGKVSDLLDFERRKRRG